MRRQSLFIDTSGWASYFHARDPLHARAVQIYQQAYGRGARIYTTDHVLAELVALLTSTHFKLPRPCVLAIIATILHDRRVIAQATGWPEFLEAWRLLEQRPDKAWSLVDAISFRAMERFMIRDALATDEHVEQAGKVRLLKERFGGRRADSTRRWSRGRQGAYHRRLRSAPVWGQYPSSGGIMSEAGRAAVVGRATRVSPRPARTYGGGSRGGGRSGGGVVVTGEGMPVRTRVPWIWRIVGAGV